MPAVNIGKEGGINFFTSLSALEEEKKDCSLYKRILSYDWTHPSFRARIKNIIKYFMIFYISFPII